MTHQWFFWVRFLNVSNSSLFTFLENFFLSNRNRLFSGKNNFTVFADRQIFDKLFFSRPGLIRIFPVLSSFSGCSGFFKRSIHRNRVYTCKAQGEFKGKCPIDKTHRNQCRACRLRKCFESAMNRDGRSLCSKLFVLNHVSSSNSRVQWTQRPNKGFKLTASSRYNDMLL